MNELPIERLGPYIIDEVVGKGAMGLVFSARHEQTDERAAIKVLAPAIASDAKFRERFAAEIESLKTLNHPNIVKLFGYGETDGHLYYAMELVEGTNLEQELAAGRRFNWRDVTQIGIDISRALKHAHDHGVIHRDLKPANLLVDVADRVKLTDFGIAKLFGTTDMTLNGNVIGTVDYMAPEQASGEATSPRSDLYSLGCVMYALLCGKPPFQGKSIPEVLHKVRYERHRSVNQFATDVPNDLSQIIDELLAKDPEDRIRTALSLSHRLRSIQQALSISTTNKADFSSDEDTNHTAPNSATNLIVNPPPDIAERPTVFLTDQERQDADTAAAERKKSTKVPKSKQDHFTRIERESRKRSELGRSSEFSSAIPLLLLLLMVLGGLLAGVWFSTTPMLSVDDLYTKIIDSSDNLDSNALTRDIERFLSHYSNDVRAKRVKEIQEEIAIKKLQRRFEIRARARPETGSLSPIEIHCNEAFRSYRKGNLEQAIGILDGIQKLYGTDREPADISIRRAMELVTRLKPQWEEELANQVIGLRANVELHRNQARELSAVDPERAREIWKGIVALYSQPWAQEFYDEAIRELAKSADQVSHGTLDSRAEETFEPECAVDDELDSHRENENEPDS